MRQHARCRTFDSAASAVHDGERVPVRLSSRRDAPTLSRWRSTAPYTAFSAAGGGICVALAAARAEAAEAGKHVQEGILACRLRPVLLCRICLDSGSEAAIRVCSCTSSVHVLCIQRWQAGQVCAVASESPAAHETRQGADRRSRRALTRPRHQAAAPKRPNCAEWASCCEARPRMCRLIRAQRPP